MSGLVSLTNENKKDFIKAFNLNLVTQEGFYEDFLISDLKITAEGVKVVTQSCSELQKSDREDLIKEVFKDCGATINFLGFV